MNKAEQALRRDIRRIFLVFVLFLVAVYIFAAPEKGFYVLYGVILYGVLVGLITVWILLKLQDYLDSGKTNSFWNEHLKRVSKEDIRLFHLCKLGNYDPSPHKFDMYIQQAINKIEEQGKKGYHNSGYTLDVDIGDYVVEFWKSSHYENIKSYKLYHKTDRSKRYSSEDLPILSTRQKDIIVQHS